MKVKIINYSNILYTGYIKSLIAPGKNGKFQLLKNHISFISILKNGHIILIEKNNKVKQIKIQKGILKINKNLIVILI